jgi:hypothetical protein
MKSVTQKVLSGNAVLAALLPGRKYDSISQNGECSREGNVRTWVFRKKSVIKTPLDFFLWGYIKDTVYKTPVTPPPSMN